MSELVLQPKRSIKVRLGEAVYEVRKPNNKQLQAFSKREMKEETALEETIGLLSELGLPADVAWDLDPESLNEIVLALIPQKKS
jgi:hypothetical protein